MNDNEKNLVVYVYMSLWRHKIDSLENSIRNSGFNSAIRVEFRYKFCLLGYFTKLIFYNATAEKLCDFK